MNETHCYKKLDKISSEIFTVKSLNLSFFDKDIINCVLSLDVIEDDDFSIETLMKYRYYSNYYILKVNMNYYFISNSYINVYYPEFDPLKINDYTVFQRKDKLKQIQENIDEDN